MDWTFGWMRSWDEVLARDHLERWRSAAVQPGSHASPFMHPDMIRGWLAAVGGPGAWDPFLMAARHAGGQQVLWLLVRPRGRHAGLVRRLLPPGEGLGGPHFAYNDPLVIPAASPDAVLAPGFWPAFHREIERHAGKWFDVLNLHRLRPECLDVEVGTPVAVGSTWVALDRYASFDDYMAARPNGLASQLRRKFRRLESQEGVDFQLHGPDDPEAALAWLPDLEASQRARYPDSVLPAGYLRSLVLRGVPGGLVRCSVLRAGGKGISWRIDYTLGGILYLAYCSFEQAWARHSPGQIHSWKMLEWHVAQGGTAYDTLIGNQSYKYDWTDGAEHRLRRVQIESGTAATVARRRAARGLGRARLLGRRAMAMLGGDAGR